MTMTTSDDSQSEQGPWSHVPPREAVLSPQEMADWLGVSVRQVQRQDFPVVYIGERTPRYVAEQILEVLQRRAL